jgi:hypothetical protein
LLPLGSYLGALRDGFWATALVDASEQRPC